MTSRRSDETPRFDTRTAAGTADAIIFTLAAFAIYGASVIYGTAINALPAQERHFSYLADAFLAGRLDVDRAAAPWLRELVPHEGKWYVVYPPMPAVVMLPWVALFGPDVHTSWISILVAACCVGMTSLLLRRTGHTPQVSRWATVVFGFGTAFWYTALKGSSWHFAHVVAVCFLLLALLEAFGKQRPLVTGLFLGMAVLSRLPILMATPVFLYLVTRARPNPVSRAVLLCAGIGLLLSLNGLYNWARYETVLDVGYYRIPGVLEDFWYPWGIFDLRYVPRSLYALLLQGPVLVTTFPFVVPSLIGLGIFFTTPAFFLMFLAPAHRLTYVSLCAVILIAIPVLLHGGIGATQFGHRFSLDFTPFLVLLTAQGLRAAVSGRAKTLVAISVLVSLWGLGFASPVQPGWLGPEGLGLEQPAPARAPVPSREP